MVEKHNKFLNAMYMLRLLVQSEKDICDENYYNQTEIFEEIEKILKSKDF